MESRATHGKTWIVLNIIGVILAVIGASVGGLFGFVALGLIWFGLAVLYSVIIKRTGWLGGLPRVALGGVAAVALVLGFVSVGQTASQPASNVSPTSSSTPATPAAPSLVIEVKQEVRTEAVSFKSQDVDDSTLPQGETSIRTEGADGVRTITEDVTYTDGVETKRVKIADDVTTQPVAKVTAHGTKAPVATQAPQQTQVPQTQVPQTQAPKATNSAPNGATAQCKDGSYSFSQNRKGTCSHHGGVASWL